MTGESNPAKPVLVFTGLVVVLLAAMLLLPAACGLLALSQGPSPDGSQSLGRAEQRLLSTTREAARDAMGPGARLRTAPETGRNPWTTPCEGADTSRVDGPETSRYTYTVTGVDPGRYATYAAALGRYLSSRGWTAEGTGPEATWRRDSYTLTMYRLPGPSRIVLEARTPCLHDDRP